MFDGEFASLNAILETSTVHVPRPVKVKTKSCQALQMLNLCRQVAHGAGTFSWKAESTLAEKVTQVFKSQQSQGSSPGICS